MSIKFSKNRSVDYLYMKMPMFYTGIINSKNHNKELVIIDDFKYFFIACWRNNKTNKCGINFKVKIEKNCFIFKDKKYDIKNFKKVY
jgi:hypothetical protein